MISVLFIISGIGCVQHTAMMSLIARFFLACALFSTVFGTSFVFALNDSSLVSFWWSWELYCLKRRSSIRSSIRQRMGEWGINIWVLFHCWITPNCTTSDDGRYLLPDNVFLYPSQGKQSAHVRRAHWKVYASTTTKSINAESLRKFSFGRTGGSYSSEYCKFVLKLLLGTLRTVNNRWPVGF